MTALFFCNGALFANWVPRIPDVKAALGLDAGALGAAVLFVGLGAAVGSVAAGPLDARVGSRTVTTASCLVLATCLALLGMTTSWATLAVTLGAAGCVDAVMDVSMNAQAVTLQARYGRSIINGFHAWWSLGAVAGGLTGTLATAQSVPVTVHLAISGIALTLVVVGARRWLVDASTGAAGASKADDAMAADGATSAGDATAAGDAASVERRSAPRNRRVVSGAMAGLGILALLSTFIEDVPGTWSAVYLRESLGAGAGVAGLGFVAFTAAMTVTRLAGDRVVERFGMRTTLVVGGSIGAVGMALGLVIATPVATIAGFGLLALGVGIVFPLAMVLAGDLPGVSPGVGIGVVSTIARGGFLISPVVIGALADAVGLRVALSAVVLACAGVVLATGWSVAHSAAGRPARA